MKQVVTVTEVEGEGLDALLNENVLIMCGNYFYAGRLVGVNEKFIKLDNASIVYETGGWNTPDWKTAESLGKNPHYIMVAHIEGFRKGK